MKYLCIYVHGNSNIVLLFHFIWNLFKTVRNVIITKRNHIVDITHYHNEISARYYVYNQCSNLHLRLIIPFTIVPISARVIYFVPQLYVFRMSHTKALYCRLCCVPGINFIYTMQRSSFHINKVLFRAVEFM